MSSREVFEAVKRNGIRFVQIQFADLLGEVRNVTIPATKLEDAFEKGVPCDNSLVLGYPAPEKRDLYLFPLPETFVVLPWRRYVAAMLCRVEDEEKKRFSGDPRACLEKVVEEARKSGWLPRTATSCDFFLFPREGLNRFVELTDKGERVREDMIEYLSQMGVKVEGSGQGIAPNQHEVSLAGTSALNSADWVVRFKHAAKVTAEQNGAFVSFMPQPAQGIEGSGMRVCCSLFTLDGKNGFYDSRGPYRLSKVALHFIAGLLHYAKEICAILNSRVNSFKRIVSGVAYICWSNLNRRACIRVPAARGRETSIEVRSPDVAGNPYLQFAIILAAGLEGVRRKLEPPEPIEKDPSQMDRFERKALGIDELPDNLGRALEYMRQSQLVREILGEYLFEHFVYIKQQEWEKYRGEISRGELDFPGS